MATSMGADHVIDYTQEDFTQNGLHYDLILAANGYHSISDYQRALSPNGIYVMTGGSGPQLVQVMLQGPWISMTGSQKMSNMVLKPNKKDLIFMKGLLEAGKVKPVIDRCYPLSEVPSAFRYLAEGHAQGKVVITVAQNNLT
jgi:NADPH:quinone reductase-like Zn-dependent oxidoreductase